MNVLEELMAHEARPDWTPDEESLVRAGERRAAATRAYWRVAAWLLTLAALGVAVFEAWFNYRLLAVAFGGE